MNTQEATAESLALALNEDDSMLAAMPNEWEQQQDASFQYERVIYNHPAYDYAATDSFGSAYIADGCKYATKDGRMVRYNEQDGIWEARERPEVIPSEDN